MKQKQKQSQKVIVNIGTGGTRRRRRRGRKAPSSQVNIQPIVLPPQTDYTPILTAMLNHQTNSIRPPPIPQNTPSPLSLGSQGVPASVMAGIEAQRRAGPTASNFQPMPSQADERFSMSKEDVRVRPPDPVFSERLVKGQGESGGNQPLVQEAQARPKKGRPLKSGNIAVGEPVTGDVLAGIRQGTKGLQASEEFHQSVADKQQEEQPKISKKKSKKKTAPNF